MNITERRKFILAKLQKEKEVKIHELSELLKVSEVTIRKDLKFFEKKSLLFVTKGGASLENPYTNERSIDEKKLINVGEKQKIAKAALAMIRDGDSLIIGSGTTVFQLSKLLFKRNGVTVITPALKVALELCNVNGIEVVQLGGVLRPNSSSVAGHAAEGSLKNISSNLLFLGVDGIDLDFGLSITNLAEASLNRAMIESSQSLIVMADSSKFGRRALGKVCDLKQVHTIITDDKVSSSIVKSLRSRAVQVVIAK